MARVSKRDGTRHRKVESRLFADERFRRLTPLKPSGQALWLYLLVGPFTRNVPGLIVAGEAAMAEALGWPLKAFRACWAELEASGMALADWASRVVWLPKAIRHNAPDNPNVVMSWRAAITETPECDLKRQALSDLLAFLKGLGEPFAEPLREQFAEPLRERYGQSGAGAGAGAGAGVPRDGTVPREPDQDPSPERGFTTTLASPIAAASPETPSPQAPAAGRSRPDPGMPPAAGPAVEPLDVASVAHGLELRIGCSYQQAAKAVGVVHTAGASLEWIQARVLATKPPSAPWAWQDAAALAWKERDAKPWTPFLGKASRPIQPSETR